MHNLKQLNFELVDLEQQNMVKKEELNRKIVNLMLKMEDLSNPPFYHMCLFQDHGYVNNHVINYDRILYLSSYRCDDANIDLNSGRFTAGFPGTYTVTWSLRARIYWRNRIYLRKNKIQIKESSLEFYNERDHYEFVQGTFLS